MPLLAIVADDLTGACDAAAPFAAAGYRTVVWLGKGPPDGPPPDVLAVDANTRDLPDERVAREQTEVALRARTIPSLAPAREPPPTRAPDVPWLVVGGSQHPATATQVALLAELRAAGMDAHGPVPPDSVFLRALGGEFDAVVAMYHDQGHIPAKLTGFDDTVNITLGLPIHRTSVDHGTAFDRAGRGTADPTNMIAAIALGTQLARGWGEGGLRHPPALSTRRYHI